MTAFTRPTSDLTSFAIFADIFDSCIANSDTCSFVPTASDHNGLLGDHLDDQNSLETEDDNDELRESNRRSQNITRVYSPSRCVCKIYLMRKREKERLNATS
ncbi:unnamed protein product [Zymoseptoria tritici ST99CH_1A5]|uniref:Uncharacterized protein n=1 Tax=Zymoseptoria tritici ST99CH_1A5 TaxID=1276529 RepID=A0A1Y6M0K1_ZYMTR|nr:unnamed protein product [Zymoseptoria tritici ST99CH_1A5]